MGLFNKRKRLRKATEEDDVRLAQAMQENKVGFKDGFAMIVAALFTIILPCLLILVGICLLAMLLFGML